MHFPEDVYNEIFHKNVQPLSQEGAIVKPTKPAKKVEEPEQKEEPETEPEQEEEVAEPEGEADDPE